MNRFLDRLKSAGGGDTVNLTGNFDGAVVNVERGAASTTFGWSAFSNKLRQHIGNPTLVFQKTAASAVGQYEQVDSGVSHTVDDDANLTTVTFDGSKNPDERFAAIGILYVKIKSESGKKK